MRPPPPCPGARAAPGASAADRKAPQAHPLSTPLRLKLDPTSGPAVGLRGARGEILPLNAGSACRGDRDWRPWAAGPGDERPRTHDAAPATPPWRPSRCPLQLDAPSRRLLQLDAPSRRLLQLDARARLLKLGLEPIGLVAVAAFLDHLKLLVASAVQHNVKCALLHGLSAALGVRGGRRRGGSRVRDRGGRHT